MTIYEMHLLFRDMVDKASSYASPAITYNLADRYFNDAIEKFIRTRYDGNNIHRHTFEKVQRTTDELGDLVTHVYLPAEPDEVAFQDPLYSTLEFTLPADHWYTIYHHMICDRIPCNPTERPCFEQDPALTERIRVSLAARRHNEITTLLSDPFNKPQNRQSFFVRYNRRLVVFIRKDHYSNCELHLGYIRQYQPMRNGVTYLIELDPTTGRPLLNSSNPENWTNKQFWFHPATHRIIVAYAAQSFLQNTENPNYQSFIPETISKE